VVFRDEDAARTPIVLVGDFNVAPEPRDVYDPVALEGKIHFSAEERAALERLRSRGLVDAFRLKRPEDGLYSWWDYRQGAFRRDLGYRIDHIWVTPDVADNVVSAEIDREERTKDHCSDHAPVLVELAV
jgi:exodeoxyribonuclease-3